MPGGLIYIIIHLYVLISSEGPESISNIQSGSQFPKNPDGLDFNKLTERLGNVEHSQRLSSLQRNEIVTAGQIEFHPKGTVVLREGDPWAGLFVLFKGQVNLSMIGIQGQKCIITIIRPVIMFNEVAVLDGGPNPVPATAVQEWATWPLGHERYMMMMQQYPEMGIGLLNILASRHQLMLSRFEDLFSRTVQARTTKVLFRSERPRPKPDQSPRTRQWAKNLCCLNRIIKVNCLLLVSPFQIAPVVTIAIPLLNREPCTNT